MIGTAIHLWDALLRRHGLVATVASTAQAIAPTAAIFAVLFLGVAALLARTLRRDITAEATGGPEADAAGMSPQKIIEKTRRAAFEYNRLTYELHFKRPSEFSGKDWATERRRAQHLAALCQSMETLMTENE